jgi:hypothetical protein
MCVWVLNASVVRYMLGLGLYALLVALDHPPALEHALCLICFVAGPVGIRNFLDGAFHAKPLTLARITVGQTPLLAAWGYLLLDMVIMIFLAYLHAAAHTRDTRVASIRDGRDHYRPPQRQPPDLVL